MGIRMKKRKKSTIVPDPHLPEKVAEKTAGRTTRRARVHFLQIYLTIAVVCLIALSLLAHFFAYFTIDLTITRAIQTIQAPFFSNLMVFLSYIGFNPQSEIFVAVICIGLYLVGLRWEGVVGLLNALISTIVSSSVKVLVGRPRPSVNIVHVFTHLSEYSYPSGHVVFYTAFMGYLWFLVFILLRKSVLRTVFLGILTFFIVLIGPSRIFLGAHWASDVFGAYIFGSLCLLGTIYFYNWGKRRYFVKQKVAPEVKK